MPSNERRKNWRVIALIVAFNILFWGGVLAAAAGAPFGKYLIYAALILCVLMAWGGLLVIAFTSLYQTSKTSGVTHVAKQVGTVFFVFVFWLGRYGVRS